MKMRKLIYILIFLFFSVPAGASHIVGGEIYYDCLGGNNYKITLKLYRDCFNGQASYDDPAYVFVFSQSGNLVDSIPIAFPGSDTLPLITNSLCFSGPNNICVEEAIYSTTVSLPPISGGYDITYQRCCRNSTALNLINPGSLGSTYSIHIPDASLASCNSSPRFRHFPPVYICANNSISFDHSAVDMDGDSLVYSFCDAYSGASSCCPIMGPHTNTSCGNPCPVIPPAPPYQFVQYKPPYSGAYPISSSPALSIDPRTGLITGTPNMIGQWVVAVCVSEYRNGKFLSENKRDFQFNITPCPALPIASVPSPQISCAGEAVQFSNNSANSASYLWDFGDPNSGAKNSSAAASPMHNYSDSGAYYVTLICNPGSPCADTGKTTVYIASLLGLQVPNVFTPNSDGVGDLFSIKVYSGIFLSQTKLQIFNRWGQLFYETSDILKPWDGTYKGNDASEGVYYWILNYQILNDPCGSTKPITRKGFLTLLR